VIAGAARSPSDALIGYSPGARCCHPSTAAVGELDRLVQTGETLEVLDHAETEVGAISVPRVRTVVVLPEPFGPRNPNTSPYPT
jgi:hypothetical protein